MSKQERKHEALQFAQQGFPSHAVNKGKETARGRHDITGIAAGSSDAGLKEIDSFISKEFILLFIAFINFPFFLSYPEQ